MPLRFAPMLVLIPLWTHGTPLMAQAVSRDPAAGAPSQTKAPGSGEPPATGFFLLGGRSVAMVQLEQITYVGDCPGDQQPELRNLSFLAAAPPAPYQRLLLQNQTTGGYTDREYDERRPSSQSFSAVLGQGQRGSALTLAPGLNNFSYLVRQRLQNRMVDRGSASLQVAINRSTRIRNFEEIREELYCSGDRSRNSTTELNACPNGLVTLERIGVCPGGGRTTLSLESIRRGGYGPGFYGGGYPQGGDPSGGWDDRRPGGGGGRKPNKSR
jgi:hypothetical protein